MESQKWLSQYDGVHNFNIDLRPGKQEIRLHLKPDAVALGLNVEAMSSQLSTAFQGAKISDIQAGVDQYEINVQLDAESRNTLESFLDFEFILPRWCAGSFAIGRQFRNDLRLVQNLASRRLADGHVDRRHVHSGGEHVELDARVQV